MRTIAITCGDPSGVGPEIIEEWMGRKGKDCVDVCLIGPSLWLENLDTGNRCSTLAVGPDDFRIIPGKGADASGRVFISWTDGILCSSLGRPADNGICWCPHEVGTHDLACPSKGNI